MELELNLKASRDITKEKTGKIVKNPIDTIKKNPSKIKNPIQNHKNHKNPFQK